jgi:hypothetical protein
MTGHAIALLMLGTSTMACGSTPDGPMAIDNVIANIDALNGRTIRVAGYLGDCRAYECSLFRNPSEKAEADRYYHELMAAAQEGRRPAVTGPGPTFLGIGSGENFEFYRRAAPYTNGYVVITGRVTNGCRYNGRPACVDRTTDVEPTQIGRWSPPEADVRNPAQ